MPAPWTPQQDGKILEDFWAGRVVVCPACGEKLSTNLNPTMDGYFLLVECHQCKTNVSLDRRNDLRAAGGFPEWTPEQTSAMARIAFQGGSVRCPVDEAPVSAKQGGTELGDDVHLWCMRCNQHATVEKE